MSLRSGWNGSVAMAASSIPASEFHEGSVIDVLLWFLGLIVVAVLALGAVLVLVSVAVFLYDRWRLLYDRWRLRRTPDTPAVRVSSAVFGADEGT